VSIIAKYAIPAGEWPELLPFLFQCSQSPQEDHREVSQFGEVFLPSRCIYTVFTLKNNKLYVTTGSNCCIIYAESKVLTALMVCYHFIFLQVVLILFSSLTETIGATFQSHLNNLQPILLKCLQDESSSRVRIAALKYG